MMTICEMCTKFRTLSVCLGLLLASSAVRVRGQSSQPAVGSGPSSGLFHSDPNHLWNRLHRTLFVRTLPDGRVFGEDELDPLLWVTGPEYLLQSEPYQRALTVLDEFLREDGQKLISNATGRALLQHDLWGLFDWLANPHAPVDQEDRYRGLRVRIARAIRSLSLTRAQIAALPDTYADAVASRKYAEAYEPARPDQAFLPAELFTPDGPWAQIVQKYSRRMGRNHEEGFGGRSVFQIFLKLPDGHSQLQRYLEQQNSWAKYHADQIAYAEGVINMDPPTPPSSGHPALPDNTQVVLLRRMMLISTDGHVVPTPVTESVRTIVIDSRQPDPIVQGRMGRRFQAFTLDRRALMQGRSGAMRAIGQDERGFDLGPEPHKGANLFVAQAGGTQPRQEQLRYFPPVKTLASCQSCHQSPHLLALGTNGFSVMMDFRLSRGTIAEIAQSNESPETPRWKESRYEFALLEGFLEASAP